MRFDYRVIRSDSFDYFCWLITCALHVHYHHLQFSHDAVNRSRRCHSWGKSQISSILKIENWSLQWKVVDYLQTVMLKLKIGAKLMLFWTILRIWRFSTFFWAYQKKVLAADVPTNYLAFTIIRYCFFFLFLYYSFFSSAASSSFVLSAHSFPHTLICRCESPIHNTILKKEKVLCTIAFATTSQILFLNDSEEFILTPNLK